MSSICRLCRTSDANSSEHLFQSAIGGRLEVPGVLCKPCNERLGNTADAELAKALEFQRTILAIEGDRGQSAFMRVVDADGRKVILQPGLLPESAEAPPVIEQRDEDTFNITAHSEKQVREIVEAYQRKRPDHVLTVSETKVKKIFPAQINTPANLHGEAFFRPAIRTALVLLAYEGLETALSLENAWRYAGGQLADDCGVKIFWSARPCPWQDTSLGDVPHRVSVRGNVEASRLEVDVRYFGDLSFCGRIATPVRRPFAVAYGVDPIKGGSVRRSDWTGEVDDPTNPSPQILAWAQIAMDNLINAAESIGWSALSWRVTKESVSKVLGYYHPGPYSREQTEAIIKCANAEIAFLKARQNGEEAAPELTERLQDAADKVRQRK